MTMHTTDISGIKEHLAVPVIGSPMFIVSGVELVVAQCRAGIIGSYPALNSRTTAALDIALSRIEQAIDGATYAVNLIAHKSNDRLDADLEVIERHRVPIVITSLGARPDVFERVNRYGGLILHDVVNDVHARKAVDRGADGLIAVAGGAGGHAGQISPFALVEEIRGWFDGPLILSGAIATGRAVLAALAMGADMAYVGTLFITADEANAADAYKDLLVQAGASDVVYTDAFSGIHANYLRASIAAAGIDPDDIRMRKTWAANRSDRKAWRDIWSAGHGVAAIRSRRRVEDIVSSLVAEYDEARRLLAEPL